MIGVRAVKVLFKSVAVGEASDVHPVACPPFSVVRGLQQLIDQPFVGQWIGVIHELIDAVCTRRQSQQIERGASDQCSAVGYGVWTDAFGLELR